MSKPRILCHGRSEGLGKALSDLCALGVSPDTEEVYHTRRNHIWRIPLDGQDATVKDFKVPGHINAVAYTTVRRSKARRSYDNAMELLRLGFLTPEPLAWAEQRTGPCHLGHSYYACRYLQYDGDMRNWERYPDAEALLEALGREMARLHRAGVWHHDFSPGNILFRRRAGGGYDFYYVDLNRMSFGQRSPRRLMRNFRCIHLDEAQTRRLARHYARAMGLDPQATADEAAHQLARYKRSKQRQQRLKSLIKIND